MVIAEYSSLRDTTDQDPYEYFATLRRKGALHWDEAMKGWLVVSDEQCRFILQNEALFRHPYADADATMVAVKGGDRNLVVLQGDDHDRMHRYAAQLFSPKNLAMYNEQHVRPIAQLLIDRFKLRGHAELFTEFCNPLPCRIFMSLFGMDAQDDAFLAHVMDLHDTIMEWAGGRHYLGEEATERALAASEQLNAILLPYIRQRRDQPADDMISRLWQEAPGLLDEVTEADILATCREFYLGGSDTTVHAMANALYLLLSDQALKSELQGDASGKLLANFIEEVMRSLGSVQYRYRIANQDIALADTQVKQNDVLFVINAAANRDPLRHDKPDTIDLHRPKPRDHIAFNTGPRMCVGAGLARAEMRIVLEQLLQQLPDVRLDPRSEPPVFKGFFTRSYRPLNVVWG